MKKNQSSEKIEKYSYNNSLSRAEKNQKYDIKSKTIEIQNKKIKKEILDNYRYIEIKNVSNNDEKRKSIVRHRRLGEPIGNETIYEKQRFSTQTNYISNKPIIYEQNNERRNYNEKNYRKITSENSKNLSNEKNNSEYKKKIEKLHNISDKNKKQITYTNSKRGQSQEDTYNKRNNNKYNQNRDIFNSKNERDKSLNKENMKTSSNLINANVKKNPRLNTNKKPSYEKFEEKIDEKNKINNNGFKSPLQNRNEGKNNEYNFKSPEANIEICKTCGKPKKPKGGIDTEKSQKIIVRELIGEKSINNYVIRYGMENETQNEPFFQISSAQGSHFCPIHGYV